MSRKVAELLPARSPTFQHETHPRSSLTDETHVVAVGREFRVLHVNRLGNAALATPAVARDSLSLRTLIQLYRIASVVEIIKP